MQPKPGLTQYNYQLGYYTKCAGLAMGQGCQFMKSCHLQNYTNANILDTAIYIQIYIPGDIEEDIWCKRYDETWDTTWEYVLLWVGGANGSESP